MGKQVRTCLLASRFRTSFFHIGITLIIKATVNRQHFKGISQTADTLMGSTICKAKARYQVLQTGSRQRKPFARARARS